jgi:hypothetical protein
MTPTELACIQSIDSAIMQLQAIRLALVSSVVKNTTEVVNNDTPSDACSHDSVQILETMGGGKVSMCLDCDLQWKAPE